MLRVPVAFALGLACLPVFLIEDRFTPQNLAGDLQRLQLVHPAGGQFFLLTANLMNVGGITTRLGAPLARPGRPFPGRPRAGERGAASLLLRRDLGVASTADAASQSKIFIEAQRKEG